MVGQNDCVSPLKSAVAVRCHLHLLHAEVGGYMCYLPLTKLSICSSEVFCLFSAHNSEMNSAFQFRNAPKLFVCLLVCFNRMYEHWWNKLGRSVDPFLPVFHPFTWYTSIWNTNRLKFLSLSWWLSVRKRLCLNTVSDPRTHGFVFKNHSLSFPTVQACTASSKGSPPSLLGAMTRSAHLASNFIRVSSLQANQMKH